MANVKRRAFLQMVGAAAATGAVARQVTAAAATTPDKPGPPREDKPQLTKAEQLAGYCGRYCATCGICSHHAELNIAALRSVVETAGFERQAKLIGWPLMNDLGSRCCAHFEAEVKSFADLNPRFFAGGCRAGCFPECPIASCCKAKGYVTCAECASLAGCSKIAETAKKYPDIRKSLKDIAEQGFSKWAQAKLDEAMSARKKQFIEGIDKVFG